MLQRCLRYTLTALTAIALIASTGCQSSQRDTNTDATAAKSEEPVMEGQMADSDAERAKTALQRDWPGGERRPATPKRRPAVDQPRTIRR